MEGAAASLRRLLAANEVIVAPGCYDCITARSIEQKGFKAAYMSGGSVSFSLGYPDYGLATLNEMGDAAGRIAGALNIPLIADADTGFGNELNVTRTVEYYESRGVAAIHLEDQEFPKRCGHLAGKAVIPTHEFASKIRAASEARRSGDFVVIARTDARAVNGLDDAIERGNAALDAGADVVFIEAPQTLEEIAAIPKRVRGPCLLNIAWGGKTPMISNAEAQSLGFRIAIHPGALLFPVVQAVDTALDTLRATDRHPVVENMAVGSMFARNGAAKWDAIRDRHVAGATAGSPWEAAK